MKTSGFKYFQFLSQVYDSMSKRRTVKLHSNVYSENENDEKKNNIENITEFLQCETSVEPITKATDKTQQSPLQIPESS